MAADQAGSEAAAIRKGRFYWVPLLGSHPVSGPHCPVVINLGDTV
jgi:hypothetical protein